MPDNGTGQPQPANGANGQPPTALAPTQGVVDPRVFAARRQQQTVLTALEAELGQLELQLGMLQMDVLKLKEMASETQYDSINSAIASITTSIQSVNLSRDALESVLGGVATAPAKVGVTEDVPTVLPHTTGPGVITMGPTADPIFGAQGSGLTGAGLDQ